MCKTYGDKQLTGYSTQYSASQKGESRMSLSWGWVHRRFVHDWEKVEDNSGNIKKSIEVWNWYLRNDPLWLKCLLEGVKQVKL